MGKTSKWLRSFLTGKKDQKEKRSIVTEESDQNQNSAIPGEVEINPVATAPATPREKRRWSFRRSSATAPTTTPRDSTNSLEEVKKKHPMTVAAATAAAAEAAVAAVEAAAAVIRLTSAAEEAAATKIQAYFRAYLSRKALRALRGLVKLQALVRGHLVRKQATATLRCMHALIALQAKARAQRLRLVDEEIDPLKPRLSTHRKSTQEIITKNIYHETDKTMEENIKIVEIDMGEMKVNTKRRNSHAKQDNFHYSPSPSAITDIMSPRAYSSHFEDYNSFVTAQSTPNCNNSYFYNADSVSSYDYPLFPNYMANTQSSRAKARSQSAPKQRPPEVYERQMSGKRRVSMEGTRQGQGHGHVPRAVPVRMQRASSNVGSTAKEYRYPPWMAAVKLDRSNVSVKESECGSTSTVLTTANYCRSLVPYDVRMDL